MTDPTLRDILAAALDQARPDLAPRLQDDPAAYLELVTLARDAHSETGELLRAAVFSARRAGCTWEQIGAVLGMTKQAAHQRYGAPDEPDVEAAPARRATLAPVTAFNEMRVLERAGRYGWHGVAFGPLYFVVEASNQQWEHHRAYIGTGPLRPGGGWQRIGRWGWWEYYKRPLGEPPLQGLANVHDLVLA